MTFYRFVPVLGAGLLLSACGGGGTTETAGPPALDDLVLPAGPTEYVVLAERQIAILDTIPDTLGNPRSMVGAASFTGGMIVLDDAIPGAYLGNFTSRVDFEAETMRGTADRFYYDPNEDDTVAAVGIAVEGLVRVTEVGFFDDSVEFAADGVLDGEGLSGEGAAFITEGPSHMLGFADATFGGRPALVMITGLNDGF